MESKIKKIGVLCSGGDSPGMNACVRAVVRTAIFHGLEVFGIKRGYDGMIDDEIFEMKTSDVANIIHLGGTILKSARSARFMTVEGRKIAYENLKKRGIDSLVVIGGDGSFRGAIAFSSEHPIKINGCTGTIDNDLFGTDFTIGYDTAINVAMEAVDRIRDTANSHNRLFFIEVMGRDAGIIAMRVGLAVGAEALLVPETKNDLALLYDHLEKGWKREKTSHIVIVSEGDESGGAFAVANEVKKKFPEFDTKVSVLGHIQRGGSPTCMDRVLATRTGAAAVEALLENKHGFMVGVLHRDISYTPFENATKHHQDVNPNMLRLIEMLSA